MTATKAFVVAIAALATTSRSVVEAFGLQTWIPPFNYRISNLSSPPIESTSSFLRISYRLQFKKRRKKARALTPLTAKRAATMNEAAAGEEGDDGDDDILGRHRIMFNSRSNPITRADRNEKLFQKRLAELQDFQSIHGHGSIPTPYPSNPSMGIWAANVRQQYSLWKRAEARGAAYIGYLTPSRRQQLQLAGFDFASLTEKQFRVRLKELELFKEQYGHCMVPEKWDENVALGAWVSNIRSLYKKRMTPQGQHQRQEMNGDNSHGAQKIGNQKQKRSTRRILLQSSSAHTRKKRQRSPRFSHLDEERIQVLEEMGFVWSSIDRKWLEMLEWAKVYGVVNYAMKFSSSDTKGLGDGPGSEDPNASNNNIRVDWKYSEQHSTLNHTILLKNYHQFVHNIQNQSLLPSFHPQDKILALLSNETFAQCDDGQPLPTTTMQQMLITPQPKDLILDETVSSSLDYRIRRNDTLHQPLRIWMINQRSNYNRLAYCNDHTREKSPLLIPSTMTPQRQRALEEIYFPWSGRFPTRVEEVRHEQEILRNMERQRERERKMEQKEREEQERVELLTSSIVASVSSGDNDVVDLVEADEDIMALWDEEDDDDDEDIW